MLELIWELPYYYDEPFADGSQLPMMLVSKLAREDGVTVVLTGDGGDELFCGYESYIPGIKNNIRHKLSDRLRINRLRELVRDDLLKEINYSNLTKVYKISNYQVADNTQIRNMLLDIDTYLPDDICCKVDRATMRYSLEARNPFLDKDVVELSYRIPHEYKYHNGSLKYILKELTYDYLPKNMMDRPKQGFGIPYGRWLHGPLKEMLLDYTDEASVRNQGIFNPDKVTKFISSYMDNAPKSQFHASITPDYSDIVWAYLMFQMWYDRWKRADSDLNTNRMAQKVDNMNGFDNYKNANDEILKDLQSINASVSEKAVNAEFALNRGGRAYRVIYNIASIYGHASVDRMRDVA